MLWLRELDILKKKMCIRDREHVRCTLGHADIGLIPAWAKEAVGSVKRWFGLISDGVIIRGTFILHNDKTIEDELNGREIQIRGEMCIRDRYYSCRTHMSAVSQGNVRQCACIHRQGQSEYG